MKTGEDALSFLRTSPGLYTAEHFYFSMAASGIPLDAGTLMSTVLEGILYGEFCNRSVLPVLTKLGS